METNSGSTKSDSTGQVLRIPIYTTHNYDLTLFPQPGGRLRHWWEEDRKTKNHARFCLPMLAANSYGFYILSPADITINWDGSLESDATVQVDNAASHTAVTTHSSHGSFTVQTQIVPRTPEGIFTYIKPIPNLRLPFQPLEGLMETWWLVANFGLVTLVTQPGTHTIKRGQPIAHMLFVGSHIHNYEIYHGGFVDDLPERKEFMDKRVAYTNKQLDYMKGIHMDGSSEEIHYSKFKNTCPYHEKHTDL